MSLPNLGLRLATLDDLPDLNALIERSMRGLAAQIYSHQQVEGALRHLVGADAQLIVDRTYYVVEANGQIAGGGGWSRRNTLYGRSQVEHGGDASTFLDPATEPAKIRTFFVHPAWARRGIGRRLLQASERAACQAGFTRFELIATLSGVPLYAACGYSISEPVVLPLPDGLTFPAMKMVKTATGGWDTLGR